MTSQTLEGQLGAPVEIDLCTACQVFWFDRHESLQLSPGSTLKLFRLVGEQAASRRGPVSNEPHCPRCGAGLRLTQDKQRNTPFRYWRCGNEHGRLTTFFDFLREKDFIRPLSPAQVEELRRNVQAVNCSNCGASIDLARGSACGHCGSPLSMLDMEQAQRLIGQLRQAEPSVRPIDPTLPLQLELAKREVEKAFASFERDEDWFGDVSSSGIVGAGLKALTRWLSKS
jgi:ribosomal protein S27AE